MIQNESIYTGSDTVGMRFNMMPASLAAAMGVALCFNAISPVEGPLKVRQDGVVSAQKADYGVEQAPTSSTTERPMSPKYVAKAVLAMTEGDFSGLTAISFKEPKVSPEDPCQELEAMGYVTPEERAAAAHLAMFASHTGITEKGFAKMQMIANRGLDATKNDNMFSALSADKTSYHGFQGGVSSDKASALNATETTACYYLAKAGKKGNDILLPQTDQQTDVNSAIAGWASSPDSLRQD